MHNAVLVAVAALCLARASEEPRARPAWLAFAAGQACWALGSITWSVLHGASSDAPFPTVADVWWVLWYPFTALGVALLIRGHALRFELHRWMDGLAVTLIVLTWGAAFFLQPVIEQPDDTLLATTLTLAYPILDILLFGAILGVYGLMGWRPGGTWLILGAGILINAGADVVYAVQESRGLHLDADYDFVWTLGAVLIAVAAWSAPARALDDRAAVGWRVILLPLLAQALAASIQVYGLFFGDLGHSERILTLIVLAIASVQIIVARPRAGPRREQL
jgi:diguanylate cyclase